MLKSTHMHITERVHLKLLTSTNGYLAVHGDDHIVNLLDTVAWLYVRYCYADRSSDSLISA